MEKWLRQPSMGRTYPQVSKMKKIRIVLIPLILAVFTFSSCKHKDNNNDILTFALLYVLWKKSHQGCLGNINQSSYLLDAPPSSPELLGGTFTKIPRSVGDPEITEYVPGEVLVSFERGVSLSAARSIVSESAPAIRSANPSLTRNEKWNGYMLLKVADDRAIDETIKSLTGRPGVTDAQKNYIYRAARIPNDPEYTSSVLWGLNNDGSSFDVPDSQLNATFTITPTAGYDINGPEAWDTRTDCSSSIVAVLDTGVKYDHDDLVANMWDGSSCVDENGSAIAGGCLHGYDYSDNDKDPMDENGHGTHVSGTIGAQGNNGVGSTGVCWSTKIMAVRVLDSDGAGNSLDIASGIDFAIQNGAKVINASFGGYGADSISKSAISRAKDAGIIFVAASGNEANNNDYYPVYPASYDLSNIISVAALNTSGALASFSNYGSKSVDIAAPGTYIQSTWPYAETAERESFDGSVVTWSKGGNWYNTSTLLANQCHITSSDATVDTKSVALANNINNTNPANDWCIVRNASGNLPNYANSSSGAATGIYDFGSSDNAYVRYYIFTDLESDVDYVDVDASASGTPTFSSPLVSFTGSTQNSYYGYSHQLSSCAGSTTCGFGFKLYSNSTTNGDGPAVVLFDWVSQVYSTTTYNFEQGTSMATPHVAGAAAMLMAQNPDATYKEVITAIFNSAAPVEAGYEDFLCTGGTLDLKGALDLITP